MHTWLTICLLSRWFKPSALSPRWWDSSWAFYLAWSRSRFGMTSGCGRASWSAWRWPNPIPALWCCNSHHSRSRTCWRRCQDSRHLSFSIMSRTLPPTSRTRFSLCWACGLSRQLDKTFCRGRKHWGNSDKIKSISLGMLSHLFPRARLFFWESCKKGQSAYCCVAHLDELEKP